MTNEINDKLERQKEIKRLYREANREKIRELNRRYALKNKEKITKKNKEYYLKNKEKYKERSKAYRKSNPEIKRAYYNKRRKTDIAFKLHHNISNLLYNHLRKNNLSKSNKIEVLLNYTIKELKYYIESQFEDWMTWDNHGLVATKPKQTWHIDHIKPVNTFNITSDTCEDFKKCWALENLRPLDSYINVRRPRDGNDIL